MANNRIIVHMKNITSGDAVREVAEALLGVEGVRDVEVDEDTGSALVELVEGVAVTHDDLRRAVHKAGYGVADVQAATD